MRSAASAFANSSTGRATEAADRERRKLLWLHPVQADLRTPEALAMAKEYHVSLRLAHQIAGYVVNLPSFLAKGHVYPSQAYLAAHIKGANDQFMSDRQIRRAVAFMEARGHLRVVHRRGTLNCMFPIYRTAKTEARAPDIMSSEEGHDVLGVRTWCPPKPSTKPIIETIDSPLTPHANVVRFEAPPTATQRPEPAESSESGQPTKQGPIAARPCHHDQQPLDGEIITGVMSVHEFWQESTKCGFEGYAREEWRKLSLADRAAAGDRLRRDGPRCMRNLRVGTWLRDRVWEEPSPVKPDVSFDAVPLTANVIAHRGSDLWRFERERYRTAGDYQMVKLMDAWAERGKDWWCRREVTA
jgi:hypothetical protein